MRFLKIQVVFIFAFAQLLSAQQIDKNKNCAEILAREYFFKMGISDSIRSKNMPVIFTEVLNGKEFETQTNGIFIISNFNAHRKKMILLKKGNSIKVLTFTITSSSLKEMVEFLNELKVGDEELFQYMDFLKEYVDSSKSKIVTNKIADSDWIECN